jgi:hypothetical protein
VTEDQVKQIASRFLAEQMVIHEGKFGLSQFRHTLMGAQCHPRLPGQWSVVFEVRHVDGHVIDGPTLVLVDDTSGEARFLD